jgi:chromosome segregation ATPase
MKTRDLWIMCCVLVLGIAMAYIATASSRATTAYLRERAHGEELVRQRVLAEQEAADARQLVTVYRDSMIIVREISDNRTREAVVRATTARQKADVAEGRVRATLDSLGASTAILDSLVEAHHEEIAAVQEQLAAVTWERDVLTRYAESMEEALRTADQVAETIRWERDSLRRQVDALDRSIQTSWQVKAGAGVAAAGVLALVVLTR